MRIERDEKKKTSVTHYDTFAEYLEHVESPGKGGDSHKSGDKEWTGTNSFADAMTLAREGWPEGLEMIRKLTANLEHVSAEMVKQPEITWDVAGDFADAGLYAVGVPECMGQFVESEQVTAGAGKVVKVRMNMSVSAGVDKKAIMRRGAAACALIDALESAGRSCEVELAASTEWGWKSAVVIPVKSAGEPLEMDRMAFLLAHPASFRRLVFSAFEHERDDIRQANTYYSGGCYGRPISYTATPCDIDVPHMSLFEYPDDAALLAWIKEQLKAQGCDIEESATV